MCTHTYIYIYGVSSNFDPIGLFSTECGKRDLENDLFTCVCHNCVCLLKWFATILRIIIACVCHNSNFHPIGLFSTEPGKKDLKNDLVLRAFATIAS